MGLRIQKKPCQQLLVDQWLISIGFRILAGTEHDFRMMKHNMILLMEGIPAPVGM